MRKAGPWFNLFKNYVRFTPRSWHSLLMPPSVMIISTKGTVAPPLINPAAREQRQESSDKEVLQLSEVQLTQR